MEVFNLNIRPGKACPVLHCSQFDKGRIFRANLFDGAEVFTLTGSETLSIIEKKTDGNMVTISVTNTSDNYVVFGTTEQMTALAGCQLCELRIVDGEDLIGSLNFLLDCEESPDTGIESESAIHNLQEQIGEAVAEQYSGENVIFDNTPTAGHGVGFVVPSEVIKSELDKKVNTDDLAPVATSGDYNDLDNLPTIPENLPDLGDVEITSPTAGQIIEYDDNAGKWKNVANPASTTNFGAPYDENATYNVPSLVIQNNLLYKLNTGETDVTGPFDPTKWTQTSVADVAKEIGDLSDLTTTDKSSLVEAVNALDSAKANKATTLAGYGITDAYTKTEVENNNTRRYTTLWGTTCQTTIGRAQFLVLTNRVLYVVWLASTNDINVANVSSNTYQSGTGNVTLDNIVFTRLSNNNLKVQLPGSGTITIFG